MREYSKPPIPPKERIIKESGKVLEERTPEFGLCGCGRMAKYEDSSGLGSCNKYKRCPTYGELEKVNKELNEAITRLAINAQRILTYREGTRSYEDAEWEIKNTLREHGLDIT